MGKIHQIECFSAAYLKMQFSLLNSNQRENLIFENEYVLIDYNIVIILTNVDDHNSISLFMSFMH